jgi:hypothetical protein
MVREVRTEKITVSKDLCGNSLTKFGYNADTSMEIRRLLFKYCPLNLYKKKFIYIWFKFCP